jgi:hypothetical protein
MSPSEDLAYLLVPETSCDQQRGPEEATIISPLLPGAEEQGYGRFLPEIRVH